MQAPLKPSRLRPGERIAAVSLSSGLAAAFPHRYRAGKEQFERTFDVEVVETPNALRDDDWLHLHPQARADDLHWALSQPDIAGIVSTIGGDDSVRILPHLDLELIRSNPKVFLGFSDSTVTHTAFGLAGVVSFYGPAVLADLAENGGISPFVERSIRQVLFEAVPTNLEAASEWTEEFLDWSDPSLQTTPRKFRPGEGWTWLQGDGVVQGRLVGGCACVLEFIKGTHWWPPAEYWQGCILCLETSEEVPPPAWVGYWLRNYGMQGILSGLKGLLLARPRGYSARMKDELHHTVRRVLGEFGRSDLPVVTDLDFGHTSPQLTLPLGALAEIDPPGRRVRLLEAGVD